MGTCNPNKMELFAGAENLAKCDKHAQVTFNGLVEYIEVLEQALLQYTDAIRVRSWNDCELAPNWEAARSALGMSEPSPREQAQYLDDTIYYDDENQRRWVDTNELVDIDWLDDDISV